MSEIDINSLPYPMFKTTPEEKEILRKCLPVLKSQSEHYTCLIINLYIESYYNDNISLLNKITDSLKPWAGLGTYIVENTGLDKSLPYLFNSFELRIVWINKLLEYTGE